MINQDITHSHFTNGIGYELPSILELESSFNGKSLTNLYADYLNLKLSNPWSFEKNWIYSEMLEMKFVAKYEKSLLFNQQKADHFHLYVFFLNLGH